MFCQPLGVYFCRTLWFMLGSTTLESPRLQDRTCVVLGMEVHGGGAPQESRNLAVDGLAATLRYFQESPRYVPLATRRVHHSEGGTAQTEGVQPCRGPTSWCHSLMSCERFGRSVLLSFCVSQDIFAPSISRI
mmetsp:Transcript_12308/g.33828  ORF Transcript_12308/g.33828 Transcript_12308/m.33828 type:complete len:133 (-) Transcript_12308:698-1096(-)